MLRSSNDQTNQQNFSMRVQRRADGQFEAICKNTDKVPPTVGKTESIAISKMDSQLQLLNAQGKL